MKFLLIMNVNPQILDALTDEEKDEIMRGHGALMDTVKASGEFVSTAALAAPAETVTVQARNGVPAVTDGPFLEAKEFLGGYYMVDVESKERAVELARMVPDTRFDGLAVEVRPVIFSGDAAELES